MPVTSVAMFVTMFIKHCNLDFDLKVSGGGGVSRELCYQLFISIEISNTVFSLPLYLKSVCSNFIMLPFQVRLRDPIQPCGEWFLVSYPLALKMLLTIFFSVYHHSSFNYHSTE